MGAGTGAGAALFPLRLLTPTRSGLCSGREDGEMGGGREEKKKRRRNNKKKKRNIKHNGTQRGGISAKQAVWRSEALR